MEFNRFVWNLYRDSQEGRAAIERDLAEFIEPDTLSRGAAAFTCPLNYCEVLNDEFLENGIHRIVDINVRQEIREYSAEQAITSLDEAEKLFADIADEGVVLSDDDEGKSFGSIFGGGAFNPDLYRDVLSNIDGVSAGLHDAHPEFFIPYFFPRRFDKFQKICHFFGITLPEIPGKLQKRERALYYLDVNRALYDFRKNHELSPQELNAFLYDFAQKNITVKESSELPRPSRIWFVIGGVGNADFDYLDAIDKNSSNYWQGNLETRRGDIILMWCASPRSYLHSIWRALDEGFNDPYFYFYSMIRVGDPIKIAPIPFSKFSKHPLLGQIPAVRACFQGASGKAFPVDGYAVICELLQQQGFDISLLPSPPAVEEFSATVLENERDVELKLLEPLLRNLGFAETDWIRQFSIRMGRGERNYPDYLLGADPRAGEECALAVIECKFDINTSKDLKEAFVQAKSYALRLQAKMLALAARRGLWLFQGRSDGFSIDHFSFKTWGELSHPDVLHEVSLVIGKRVIEVAIAQRNRGRIN
ncbi:MAG: hypothetical protein Q8L69_09510 [Gallionellaceae bacterium]|nr:hypothetical protein [Gallionellaceae bacterium]